MGVRPDPQKTGFVTVENKRRNTGDALKPKTGSTTPTEEGSESISSGNTPGGEHKTENGNPVKTNSAHGRSEDDRKISRDTIVEGYKTNVEKSISKINLIIEDYKKLLDQREEEKAKREEEKAKREERKAKREEEKAKREEEKAKREERKAKREEAAKAREELAAKGI
ncbi:DDRGK domain-containing protein 1-like [Procambarus clarkii]|uniref:DDRGK domain-containing protein 1-like n=1 Tax=Procambarus clarkii TaxID=6728 RepID=UPI0037437419